MLLTNLNKSDFSYLVSEKRLLSYQLILKVYTNHFVSKSTSFLLIIAIIRIVNKNDDSVNTYFSADSSFKAAI